MAPGQQEILTESDVVLRRLTIDDAPAMFALIDSNREHLSQHNDDTADKYPTLQALEESITTPENPDRQRYGIWAGDTMVGSINITPADETAAEIGYWLASEHTGNGYATLAVRALATYGLETLGFKSIVANAHSNNIESHNVLLRSGFTYDMPNFSLLEILDQDVDLPLPDNKTHFKFIPELKARVNVPQDVIDSDIAKGKFNLAAHMDFSAEQAIDHLAATPQAELVWKVYQTSHGEQTELASVQSYVNKLLKKMDLSDADEQRVIIEEKPETLGEEEFIRVWAVRSALTLLAWQCLDAATFPEELKSKFSTDEEHLGGKGFDEAVFGVLRWAEHNPDKNLPIEIAPKIEKQIKRVYQKGEELIQFYNTKRPLLDVYRVPQSRPNEWAIPDEEISRLNVVAGLISFLAGDEAGNRFLSEAGYREL